MLAQAHSPYAWQADVDTTVVIPALSLLYLFAVGRLGAPRWRICCYAGAMVLLAVAFCVGAPERYNYAAAAPAGLAAVLARGEVPNFLERVALEGTGIAVYRPRQ